MGKQLQLAIHPGPLSLEILLLDPFLVLGMGWPTNLRIRPQAMEGRPASFSCHLRVSLPAPLHSTGPHELDPWAQAG